MKWRRYEFLVRTMNSYKTYEFNGGDGVMGTRVIAPVNSMVPALVKKDKYKSAAQPILVIQIFLQA